jgi:hypothetical protein
VAGRALVRWYPRAALHRRRKPRITRDREVTIRTAERPRECLEAAVQDVDGLDVERGLDHLRSNVRVEPIVRQPVRTGEACGPWQRRGNKSLPAEMKKGGVLVDFMRLSIFILVGNADVQAFRHCVG